MSYSEPVIQRRLDVALPLRTLELHYDFSSIANLSDKSWKRVRMGCQPFRILESSGYDGRYCTLSVLVLESIPREHLIGVMGGELEV